MKTFGLQRTEVQVQEVSGEATTSVLECGSLRPRKVVRAPWPQGRADSPQPAAARCGHLALPVRPWLFYLCFLLSAFCLRAWGQYSLDWSTIDGGGGTSTGGVYSVTGTIGQPDAGKMSGGNFTLDGGFWGLVAAVQTPGAPWLTILHTSTNSVIVSWPGPAEGWVLEHTTTLSGSPPPWAQISPPYQTNTTQCWIAVPAPSGNKFYRLHKP